MSFLLFSLTIVLTCSMHFEPLLLPPSSDALSLLILQFCSIHSLGLVFVISSEIAFKCCLSVSRSGLVSDREIDIGYRRMIVSIFLFERFGVVSSSDTSHDFFLSHLMKFRILSNIFSTHEVCKQTTRAS